MIDVFQKFKDYFVTSYLDDIFIFNKNWEEHVKNFRKVLNALKRKKLCQKMLKCELRKTYLVYLG